MTHEDHKLWKKVTETVRPLGMSDQEYLRLCAELVALDTAVDNLERAVKKATAKARKPTPQPLPVSPSTLDLHGLTVADAHRATLDFIENANRKTITIITGKSGQIRKEFERWVEPIARVHSCVEKNGGGAFQIRILKRELP